MMKIDRFIQVDEEGYFKFGDVRVAEADAGHRLLKNLSRDERGRFFTQLDDTYSWVEAFDEPIVAEQVFRKNQNSWELLAPYGFRIEFDLSTLTLDEWDRFHGYVGNGIPFVLSRKAQAEFFNLLDDYTDETISAAGHTYDVPNWLQSREEANKSQFWDNIYQGEEAPGWELEAPAAALKSVIAQLKMPKARVLVLGCGSGNDAAYFAEQGHVVKGVDISNEGIEKAKAKYGQLKNLEFAREDVFNLPESYNQSFDLVFEHTLYCAINPERRSDLVKVWRKVLVDSGHLLGVFFAMDRRTGPPFGGSEWEIRQRLKGKFNALYWTRWRHSIERRQGKELIVYAKKA